ncbi:TetR family transcriptional regulator [Kurthia sibirica]|uniref:TetR family transcriptional regulator n=1 Tax=Kurthia sibirica TaxID=202750 RepID=A0A2U3AKN3_9BACL|nr:TetR family transcriptional regulator [Kurthia sibirica]PWI25107.1 TetR family transcriptional regulator [Kurthia sibirica]GEK34027.1 hypothetical protein KSI01_15600 [Kurthia sibirica]
MSEITDPRAIRTRELLDGAFNTLIRKKSFEQITVKDITENAGVNRATFYAHYLDKYEMLDTVLGSQLKMIMQTHFSCHQALTEETLEKMMLAIFDVHNQMASQCHTGYQSIHRLVEETIKRMMTDFIAALLPSNSYQTTTATMISWAMYAAYAQSLVEKNTSVNELAKFTAQQLIRLI